MTARALHWADLARQHGHPRPDLFGQMCARILSRGVVSRAQFIKAVVRALAR